MMTSAAADRARLYHQAIRRALIAEWDPIGVGDSPNSQDEYDAYVGPIYRLLIHRRPVHEIFDFLWELETEHIGLSGNRQATEAFAHRLMRLPDELDALEP
jgi:hypothetical protein